MTCTCQHSGGDSPQLGYVSVPLLSGDAGVAQTIALMRRMIDEGVKDPSINQLAIRIVKNSGAQQFDLWAEAEAIYDWWKLNFRFVNDPVGSDGPKETIRTPQALFQGMAGDCDDFTVGLSVLLQSVGFETRIVTVASDPRDPSQFTHVYPETEIDGQWVPMDAARPGAEFGVAPERVYRKKIWDGSESGKIPGIRFSLSGYATLREGLHRRPIHPRAELRRNLGLGDDSTTAQDLAAGAQLTTAVGTQAANIILASNAAPQNIFGVVTTGAGSGSLLSQPGGYPTLPAGYVSTPFGVMSTGELLLLLVVGSIVLEKL